VVGLDTATGCDGQLGGMRRGVQWSGLWEGRVASASCPRRPAEPSEGRGVYSGGQGVSPFIPKDAAAAPAGVCEAAWATLKATREATHTCIHAYTRTLGAEQRQPATTSRPS
jgi:hypothetical protein